MRRVILDINLMKSVETYLDNLEVRLVHSERDEGR